MLASDLVVFNSRYHKDQWFEDIPGFLRQFPDHSQHGLIAGVAERATVAPVGVDLRRFDGIETGDGSVPRIVWNQRWEYDKGTDELVAALLSLARRGVDFEVVLAGAQTPTDPDEFVKVREELGERVVHYGWAEGDEYSRLLVSGDVVVSTAHHEFFGISITEAIYAGAFPVLPNRVVYPERIPGHLHAHCLYDDSSDLVDKLTWATTHEAAAEIAAALKPLMATADWSVVAPQYDELFPA